MIHLPLNSAYNADSLHKDLKLIPDNESVLLDYLQEGGIFMRPDPSDSYTSQNIDLFTAIHKQCELISFDPKRIHLWWGNVNVAELYNNWIETNCVDAQMKVSYFPFWASILVTNTTDYSSHYEKNRNNYRKKLFTFLCGESREHRINGLNIIYEKNLLDKCEWTWINSHRFGLNTWFHDKIPKSAEGHKSIFESRTWHNPGKEFFDIYDRSYFDVIPETLYYHDMFYHKEFSNWNSVFFSEKTWRSIYNKRPFLLIGNKNSLKELCKLGFKTFPHIFDESYDTLEDDERIYFILNQLTKMTVEDIHDKIYSKETETILEHNYKTMHRLINNYHEVYTNSNITESIEDIKQRRKT